MATTIHVGNLSFDTNEEDLKKFFSKYGKVTDSYIVRRGGRPRGYGFIEFDSSSSADNALAANGESLDGRDINIEKARGKIVKSNFDSPRDGNNRNDRDEGYGGGRRYGGGSNRYDGYGGGGYGGGYGGGGNRRYGGGGGGGNRYNNDDDDGGGDGYDGGSNRYGGGGNRRYGGGGGGGNRYNNDDDDGGGDGYGGGSRYGGNRSFRGGRGPMRRNFYNLRPMNNGPRNNGGYGGGGRRNYQRRSDSEKEKSTSTIYVSNLPFSIDDAQLAKLFNKYQVKTTHVVQSISGRSRGYGFVEFETEEDQQNAIKEMENFEVKGSDDRPRNITVKVALVEKPTTLNSNDAEDDE